MSFYEKRILPRLIGAACGLKAFSEQRRALIPAAHGKVLEIGIGSGLNLPFYDATRVKQLVGLEPSEKLRTLAVSAAAKTELKFDLIAGSAEKMPFADHEFDTVVMTYTLCSVGDAAAALHEVRRVLKSEGRLLFAEHGRAPEASVSRLQDFLTPAWSRVAGGCHLNRQILNLITQAGFVLEQFETGYISKAKPFAFHFRGMAR